MDASIVKSQYLYINTANRASGQPCYFSVDVAPAITCDEYERLSIAIVSFKLTRSWNWFTQSNNVFTIQNEAKSIYQSITIPEGNYTFRKLTNAMNAQIRTEIPTLTDLKFKYNPSYNQIGISGSKDTKIMFNIARSIAPAIGFDTTDFFLYGTDKYYYPINAAPLTIDKASEFRLYIENVPTSNTAVNYENDTSNQLQPSQCVFVMRADIPPGSTAYYTAQEILFCLDVDERQIQKLVFSLRDEKGNLIDYAPNFLFTVRIDTIRTDQTSVNEQVTLLKELVDYTRLNFVGTNIDTI